MLANYSFEFKRLEWWANFGNSYCLNKVREAFKKNNDETYGKFHILGGGGQQGVIFHMLSRKILNAQKAILSIFRHFYFFPLCTPPPSTTILWAK